MAYISRKEISENGVSFLFCKSERVEGAWKSVEGMLKTYPELVELYEKLNKRVEQFPASINSKIMPATYQSLIENCLEEEHNNAALDLLESFQNEHHYPPKDHIRQMMDIIVNPNVDKSIAFKSYKTLQHILYSTGSKAFEYIWDFEKTKSECEDIWLADYDNFWKFIKDKFKSTQNAEDDQSTRTLLLLEQIVSVIETDMQIKQRKLPSSILLRLIPRRIRTNLKVVVDSLIISFDLEEISMEAIHLSQRLLDQVIILSRADHISYDTLKKEIYLQINKLESSRMALFLQTLLSNTFKYQLLDKALFDSDFSGVKKQHRQLTKSPLNLAKITKLYFYSIPYKTESTAIWLHIFFLSSILQSYINAKTLRQGNMVFHGLEDEEVEMINDDSINTRLIELRKWLKKIDKNLRARSELLLDMIDADLKQISVSIQ